MIEKKFGRWKVIKPAGLINKNYYLWCQCECGRIKKVRRQNLVPGKTISCGCYISEKAKKVFSKNKYGLKHGMSRTRLYRVWQAMKGRCEYKKHRGYKNYGGRGISVCNEWKDNFVQFQKWALSHGYQDDLTIDRIDVNGNYCPENCRWITNSEQQNNRRNNHFVVLGNKKITLAQASRELNISPNTLLYRMRKGLFD